MTFNFWTFLFEIINFLVLAYVLHRLLYRPLRQGIDERRAATLKVQTDAQAALAEATATKQKLQSELAEFEHQRQDLIHQAKAQANEEKRKMLAEADVAAQQRLEEIRQTLERERSDALRSLRNDIVAQAKDLAGRFLGQAAERTLNDQLALRLLETMRNLPAGEVERLRRQWQPADGGTLELAEPLDDSAVRQIEAAVAGVLGNPVALVLQTKPNLLGGLRLRLGGELWDASLAGALNAKDETLDGVGEVPEVVPPRGYA